MRINATLSAFIRLVHSPNWLLVAISGVLLMMAFQRGLYNFTLMGLGFITLTLIAMGGFAFNDFFDYESDAIVKPDRPIPSNQISRMRAVQVSVLLFLAGLGVALAINLIAFGITVFITVFLVLYFCILQTVLRVLEQHCYRVLIRNDSSHVLRSDRASHN